MARSRDIAHAVSLFFAVRGHMRTTLARGRRLDPSAWLRVETLKFINDHDRPPMRALADYLSITAPSATSLVAGLVEDGLVVRTSDPDDRRSYRLVLSAKGRGLLRRKIVSGTRLLGELFAPLSDTELKAFIRALERINTER